MEEMEEKKKEHIFLSSPHMSKEGYEEQYVKEAFDTNWIAPLGKNVDAFEEEMCQKIGAKDAAALTTGTAAIHLALKLAGVQQGDVVFCQSLTFSASANPITYEKAIPVFIDSEWDTWNMNPQALERAFVRYEKLGKLPKAVIVVHLYGISAKIDSIKEICEKYHTPLIEDAAESLGTIYKGQYTGTFGDYGIISFNGNKIITSSGGGMLLCNTTDAKEKAAKARFWATQARDNARHYQHTQIGYNYRMSNVVAGIGRGQLKVLDERIHQKRHIYTYYLRQLEDLQGLSLMPMNDEERSNCWLTAIHLEENCKVKPIDIMMALEADDVESRPVWKPMHLQPVFEDYDFIHDRTITRHGEKSVSELIFDQGVCLPSDTKMDDSDLQRVCDVIKNLWK